jgi:trk system potassium uptake protein TrkH
MLPALAMAVVLGEYSMFAAFLIPIALGTITGLFAILSSRKIINGFRARDGFLLVFLTWFLSTLMGSLCYYIAPVNISLIDAIFESACCFSTTGATIISDFELIPRSLLFWRSINHWAGGIGIIFLTVALFPLLGVGSFQLIKAEVPGPEKERLRPRVTQTAKMLCMVYSVFTTVIICLYRIGGMSWFDAVCQGLTIVSTGGVNVHNEGFNFYNSAFIDWVTAIFMLLSVVNFTLYYKVIHGNFRELLHNTELRAFFIIFTGAALIVCVNLIPTYNSLSEAFRFGFFQTASMLSTAGNVRSDYSAWPALAQAVLLGLMFVGGCSGSTAGGIKVIRHTVLFKQALNELRRIIYPRGVFSIHLNRKVGRKDVVYGAAGFVFLYFVIVGFSTLLTAASGFDVFSSFYTSLAITGNIGTGLTASGPINSFGDFPNHLKLYYSFVMIVGRLELWTVFVLFTPTYWRR